MKNQALGQQQPSPGFVQIDLETTISFPVPVLEIKSVANHLVLTSCTLLPSNEVSLDGFVEKTFTVATPVAGTTASVESDISVFSFDIPFQTVTTVLAVPPIVTPGEFEFLTSQPLPIGFPDKSSLEMGDLAEFDQVTTETFPTPTPSPGSCQPINAFYVEFDETIGRVPGTVIAGGSPVPAPFEEGTFTSTEVKMILYVQLMFG